MAMTDGKPIRRVEETDDGVRVVVKSLRDLYDYRSANALEREYENLFTSTVPQKGGPERVRVASAAPIGGRDGWHLHGANGIYAEVPLVERELTDAERDYCESTFTHRNVDDVVEFLIPHPEDLRSAIADQDRERFDCLEAVIEDHDRRHEVLTDLQQRIEDERFQANRLHPREGYPIDLDPEWDPENDHNDDRDADHLHDMALMRKDAHLTDFRSIAGFDYWEFWHARHRLRGLYESNLEPWDLLGLDVVDAGDWTYCKECGAVAPEALFLHVDLERKDVTRRVCKRCADGKADYDGCKIYTPENVASARDERVCRLGGQRNLAGKYTGE